MRFGLVMGLAVSVLLVAVGANIGATESEDSLDGVWQLSRGEAGGKALSEKQLMEGKLVIRGDHYTVTLAGSETVKGTQKLDENGELKTIDIADESGPNKGKTCLGIYELKGDEFRVVFAPVGADRPSKFATAPGSEQWMHVWKRVKE